ncbi:hypothetical protein [Streptomyces triticiradicis]|uniref:hypothetical protein n=1 Tax=Streptomyces triticiradicis TaxID=2651189 RepID=UPI001788CA60|nr:hypothetical protein [Streptomyces triticiradicis]
MLALPDLSGALLVTDEGYSLIGGTRDFLRHSVPEGVDQAIIDFGRYAKRVGTSHPALADVSKAFRPHEVAWASKGDVAAGSATAEQVSLMESLAAGRISAEEFAQSWLAARRRSLHLREPFSGVLDQVFYALDDYVIGPGLRTRLVPDTGRPSGRPGHPRRLGPRVRLQRSSGGGSWSGDTAP